MKKPHRLIEIEFYLKGTKHCDVFSHQHGDQKSCGKWYFHKSGSGDTYKSGTYKGMDLAFGNKDAFAGVLIRCIEDLGSKKLIEGPCMCVDHILSVNEVSSIIELVKKFDRSAEKSPGSPLYLAPTSKLETKPIYKSPRVGLTLKKEDSRDERKKYIMKPYRYFTAVDKLKKGRHYIVAHLYGIEGKTKQEVTKLTKAPQASVERFTLEFDKGLKKKVENYFGECLEPDNTCSLYGAWKTAFP